MPAQHAALLQLLYSNPSHRTMLSPIPFPKWRLCSLPAQINLSSVWTPSGPLLLSVSCLISISWPDCGPQCLRFCLLHCSPPNTYFQAEHIVGSQPVGEHVEQFSVRQVEDGRERAQAHRTQMHRCLGPPQNQSPWLDMSSTCISSHFDFFLIFKDGSSTRQHS